MKRTTFGLIGLFFALVSEAQTSYKSFFDAGFTKRRFDLLKPYIIDSDKFWLLYSNFTSDRGVTKVPYSNGELLGYRIVTKDFPHYQFVFESDSSLLDLTFESVAINGVQKFDIRVSLSDGRKLKTAILQNDVPNFIELPSSPSSLANGFADLNSAFASPSFAVPANDGEDIPYDQVDFDPLDIELEWCEKFLGIRICGTKKVKLKFGKVFSGSDIKTSNGSGHNYFSKPTDIDAIQRPRAVSDLSQFPDISLSSVILDRPARELTIMSEGLNPIQYGRNSSEYHFKDPLAIKVMGNKIYVLDNGNSVQNTSASLVVFEIDRSLLGSDNGNNSLIHLGTYSIHNHYVPVYDLGGYQVIDRSNPNSETVLEEHLIVSSIHSVDKFQVNKINGSILPDSRRILLSGTLLNQFDKKTSFAKITRLDASNSYRYSGGETRSGYAVFRNINNEIFGLSNYEMEEGDLTHLVFSSFSKVDNQKCKISNLAYLSVAQRWVCTSEPGGLHFLLKDGTYLGGAENFGSSEGDNELYYPFAVTPNPITNSENDFCYRFIVGNMWSERTGFKLFSPLVNFGPIRVFESTSNSEITTFDENFQNEKITNIKDKEIAISFYTTGQYNWMEKAKGMTFDHVEINDATVKESIWKNSIPSYLDTDVVPINYLSNKPELFVFKPVDRDASTSPSSNEVLLKRGWNKLTLFVKIYMIDGSFNIVKKSVLFYWIPSQFAPISAPGLSSRIVNETNTPINFNGIENAFTASSIVYKPIEITGNSIFLTENNKTLFKKYGNLIVNTNSTFLAGKLSDNELCEIIFPDDEKRLFVKDGGFVCISENPNVGVHSPNSIELEPGYIKGKNPDILEKNFNCSSACSFMVNYKPVTNLFCKLIKNESSAELSIEIDPSGTSYCDKYQFSITEFDAEGNNITTQTTISSIQEANSFPLQLTSTTLVFPGYQIKGCHIYELTLKTQCFPFDTWEAKVFRINSKLDISFEPYQSVCSEELTLHLTSPALSNSFWTGPCQVSTGNTLMVSCLPLGESTFHYNVVLGECTISKARLINKLLKPSPIQILSSSSNPFCKPNLAGTNLTCQSSPSITTYQWYSTEGSIDGTTYEKIGVTEQPTFNWIPQNAGKYKVVAINNFLSCSSDLKSSPSFQLDVVDFPISGPSDFVFFHCENPRTIVASTNPSGNGSWSCPSNPTFVYQSPSLSGSWEFLPGSDFTGDAVITYTVQHPAASCSNTINVIATVKEWPESLDDISLCSTEAPFELDSPWGDEASGSWSGSNYLSGNLFNPVLSGAGTFYITYTNPTGRPAAECPSSVQQKIIVEPGPDFSPLFSNVSICAYATATISAPSLTGTVIYSWTGPNGFSFTGRQTTRKLITTEDAGAYICTITKNGCAKTYTLNLTVIEQTPALEIPQISPFSASAGPFDLSTVSASVPGGIWEGEGVANGIFTPSMDLLGLNTLTYTIAGTGGCSVSAETEVKVVGPPTVTIGSNPILPICSGTFTTATLYAFPVGEGSALNDFAFEWRKIPNSNIIGTNLSLDISVAGTYEVKVTNGIFGSATAQIIFQPLPDPTDLPTIILRSGTDCAPVLECSVPGIDNTRKSDYTYSWFRNGIKIGHKSDYFIELSDFINYPWSGSYTVQIIKPCICATCPSQTSLPYEIAPSPVGSILSTPELPYGSNILKVCSKPYLYASIPPGALFLGWLKDGQTFSLTTQSISPLESGSYSFRYKFGLMCEHVSNSMQVKIQEMNTPEYLCGEAYSDGQLCLPEDKNFFLAIDNIYSSYQWYEEGVNCLFQKIDGATYRGITLNHNHQNQDKTYIVTAYRNGCIVAGNPIHVNYHHIDAGSDVSVSCSNGVVALNGGTPSGGVWSGQRVVFGSYLDIAEEPVPSSFRVTYTKTYPEGCALSDDKVVFTRNSLPTPTIEGETVLCDQSPVLSVTGTGATTYSYRWFLNGEPVAGQNGNTLSNPVAGSYEVEIASLSNPACTKRSLPFILHPPPSLDITADHNPTFFHCDHLSLQATGLIPTGGVVTWYKTTMSGNQGVQIEIGTGNPITITDPGHYKISFSYATGSCTFYSSLKDVKIAPLELLVQNMKFCPGADYYPNLLIKGLNDNEMPAVTWKLNWMSQLHTYNGLNPQIQTYGDWEVEKSITLKVGNGTPDGICVLETTFMATQHEFSCCIGNPPLPWNNYDGILHGSLAAMQTTNPEYFTDSGTDYPVLNSGKYLVDADLMFDIPNLRISYVDFVIDAAPISNTSISVEPNPDQWFSPGSGKITITKPVLVGNDVTFKGNCEKMWKGIFVDDFNPGIYGVAFEGNVERIRIQDALFGITNGTDLGNPPWFRKIRNVDFVNCYYGLKLSRYSGDLVMDNNKFFSTNVNDLKYPMASHLFHSAEFNTGFGCYFSNQNPQGIMPSSWIFTNNEFSNLMVGLTLSGIPNTFTHSWSGNKLHDIIKVGLDYRNSGINPNIFTGPLTFKTTAKNEAQSTAFNAHFGFSENLSVMLHNPLTGTTPTDFTLSGLEINGPGLYPELPDAPQYLGVLSGNRLKVNDCIFRDLNRAVEFSGDNDAVELVGNSFEGNYVGVHVKPEAGLDGPTQLLLKCNSFKDVDVIGTVPRFGFLKNSSVPLKIGDGISSSSDNRTKNGWPWAYSIPSASYNYSTPEGWTSLKNISSSSLNSLTYFYIDGEALVNVENSIAGEVNLSSSNKPFGTDCENLVETQFLPRPAEVSSDIRQGEIPLTVFPSPTSGKVFIKFPDSRENDLTFHIVDLIGNYLPGVIFHKSDTADSDYWYDVSALPSGLYYLKAERPGAKSVGVKFVVIH